eukprot:551737-Pyramimonas_sp.AAC.1
MLINGASTQLGRLRAAEPRWSGAAMTWPSCSRQRRGDAVKAKQARRAQKSVRGASKRRRR